MQTAHRIGKIEEEKRSENKIHTAHILMSEAAWPLSTLRQ